MTFDLAGWSESRLDRVESALTRWVPYKAPARLADAMRYAVLGGGKRLRPLLLLATSEAVAGQDEAALRAACAVELIHAYSLVHDDMPCMDNDVLRRGRPTVHVEFGEALAVLAGNALQALAFELLVPAASTMAARTQAQLCRLLAKAASCGGMAGGQALDLAAVGQTLTEQELRRMHTMKTGALLEASVMMGAACGDPPANALAGLRSYGKALGLAYQVVDDILDVTCDSENLGKTPGKDARQDKPTYVSVMGLERARAYANSLLDQAHAALSASRLAHTEVLAALAEFVVNRRN